MASVALPSELWLEIFSHIDEFDTKLACRLVNRQWRSWMDDRQPWRRHFDKLKVSIHRENGRGKDDHVVLAYGLNGNPLEWRVACSNEATAEQRRRQKSILDSHRRFLAYILARIPLRSLRVQYYYRPPESATALVDLWTAIMAVPNSQLTSIDFSSLYSYNSEGAVLGRVAQLIGRLKPGARHSIAVDLEKRWFS